MFDWLPKDVELMRDLSAADPIVATLEPWSSDGVRLASFMPGGFESYVRVFHPFLDRDGILPPRRWQDVAADAGEVLGPGTMVADIADLSDPDRLPRDGRVPEEICGLLVGLLRARTSNPDVCWFAVWSGWGTFTDAELEGTPQIHEPHRNTGRSYLLFRGPIEATCSFEPEGWPISPSLWWPDDCAWAVVTEIDGSSTYVGGDRDTVDAILGREELESIEVDRNVRIG
jgi:hypothetical protein